MSAVETQLHQVGQPLPVIVVDDHSVVRRGIAALLRLDGRYQVVAEASNGDEAMAWAERIRTGVMILDMQMPRVNGLETLRRLSGRQPGIKVLILSMYDDLALVAQALQDGARGYMLKQAMEDEALFEALQRISADEIYIGAGIDRERLDLASAQASGGLTQREREVLQLICDGQTTSQVARSLSISPHTANRHRANVMQKLHAHNQADLVRNALAAGLILPDRGPSSSS